MSLNREKEALSWGGDNGTLRLLHLVCQLQSSLQLIGPFWFAKKTKFSFLSRRLQRGSAGVVGGGVLSWCSVVVMECELSCSHSIQPCHRFPAAWPDYASLNFPLPSARLWLPSSSILSLDRAAPSTFLFCGSPPTSAVHLLSPLLFYRVYRMYSIYNIQREHIETIYICICIVYIK